MLEGGAQFSVSAVALDGFFVRLHCLFIPLQLQQQLCVLWEARQREDMGEGERRAEQRRGRGEGRGTGEEQEEGRGEEEEEGGGRGRGEGRGRGREERGATERGEANQR